MTDLGNGLLAVSVPEDAIGFKISGLNFFCYRYAEFLKWNVIEPELPCNFEILGTVTASDIDFDVVPYVEKWHTEATNVDIWTYKDYLNKETLYLYPELSFRSLLSSKGLFFENHYGKEKPEKELDKFLEWETAEQNLVQKLIILKRL